MNLIYFFCIYLVIFSLAETAKRKLHWLSETTRWYTHVAAGIVSVLLPLFVSRNQIFILSASFVVALLISRRKNILRSLHEVERAGWGELFFPIGVGVAAWYWLPAHQEGYMFAMLVMTLGDSMANIVGRSINSKKIIFNKGLAGFSACVVTVFLIGLFFFSPFGALWRAVVLSVVELMSPRGTDNLSLIVAAIFLI